MLPRRHRLSQGTALSGAPRTRRSQSLLVKEFRGRTPLPRFTVVVGRGVDARATARNRIQRFLLQSIAAHLPEYAPNDFVIVLRAPLKNLEPERLERELHELLLQR